MSNIIRRTASWQVHELHDEIIGIDKDNSERDSETIRQIYSENFNYNKCVPKFSDIETDVIEENFRICQEIAVIQFDELYKKDVETHFNANRHILPDGIAESDIFINQIKALTGNLMNDICWQHSEDIRVLIRESLDYWGCVYEDDDPRNPILRSILFDNDEYVVMVNDAQLVMFDELQLSGAGASSILADGLSDTSSDFKIERRRNIHHSRILGPGGMKNV